MKKIIEEFFSHFFSNPVLPLLVIVCSISAMALTSDRDATAENEQIEYARQKQLMQLAAVTTSSAQAETAVTSSSAETTEKLTAASETQTVTTTTTTAAAETTTAAETTEPVTEAPAENPPAPPVEQPQVSDYSVFMGAESPNGAFYQDKLVIIGDSIASGFCAYGYIPGNHNVAKESLALWNMNNYTFDVGGGAMSAVDAAAYTGSPLIFISIGMNDILGMSPDDYGARMCALAQQVASVLPDSTIVVGSITPVSDGNYYTDNATIRSFNSALENAINSAGSPQILFFSTYSVLCDPNTLALSYNAAGGDGLHLNGSSYGWVLNALFNYLDTAGAYERIQATGR